MSIFESEEILIEILYNFSTKNLFTIYSNVSKKWRKAVFYVLLNPRFNVDFEEFDKEEAIKKKHQGNGELEKKNYKLALKYYQESILFDPTVPEPFINRSMVNFQLGNYQDALNDATRAINLAPKLKNGYLQKGFILKSLGYDTSYFNLIALKALGVNIDSQIKELVKGTRETDVKLDLSENYLTESKEKPQSSLESSQLIYDISTISNLCYTSPEKFLKKFNYELYPFYSKFTFKLSSSMVFDDKMLVLVSKHNPEYKVLEIPGCRNITLDGILYCKENYLKDLKKIDLRNCYNFQKEEIKILQDNGLEVIYSSEFKSEPNPHKNKSVYFTEEHLEFLKLLQLENESFEKGIQASKIISQFRKLSLVYHPDLNTELSDTKAISRLNFLMDHLYTLLNEGGYKILFFYPPQETELLTIE